MFFRVGLGRGTLWPFMNLRGCTTKIDQRVRDSLCFKDDFTCHNHGTNLKEVARCGNTGSDLFHNSRIIRHVFRHDRFTRRHLALGGGFGGVFRSSRNDSDPGSRVL